MDHLTLNDHKERYLLYWIWQGYLLVKDFKGADKYRELYRKWDEPLGEPWTWIPLYESTEHRYNRIHSMGA